MVPGANQVSVSGKATPGHPANHLYGKLRLSIPRTGKTSKGVSIRSATPYACRERVRQVNFLGKATAGDSANH